MKCPCEVLVGFAEHGLARHLPISFLYDSASPGISSLSLLYLVLGRMLWV